MLWTSSYDLLSASLLLENGEEDIDYPAQWAALTYCPATPLPTPAMMSDVDGAPEEHEPDNDCMNLITAYLQTKKGKIMAAETVRCPHLPPQDHLLLSPPKTNPFFLIHSFNCLPPLLLVHYLVSPCFMTTSVPPGYFWILFPSFSTIKIFIPSIKNVLKNTRMADFTSKSEIWVISGMSKMWSIFQQRDPPDTLSGHLCVFRILMLCSQIYNIIVLKIRRYIRLAKIVYTIISYIIYKRFTLIYRMGLSNLFVWSISIHTWGQLIRQYPALHWCWWGFL